MRWIGVGVVMLGLAACAPVSQGPVVQRPTLPLPGGQGTAQPSPLPAYVPDVPAGQGLATFRAVIARVEPVAEAMCRAQTYGVSCDYQITVDARPGQPPNAYQTLDPAGRPIVAFTTALIADAQNADELAFVLGHETAHHIAGHIPRQQESAMTGALLAGVLASIGGADDATIQQVQQMGATVGARRFSKDFELEADALGTEIAYNAGFDPLRGALFFDRLQDPGDQFLGSHPPNAARRDVVRQTMQRLR